MPRPISCLRCLLLGAVVFLGFSGAALSTCSGILLYQLQDFELLAPSNVNGSSLSLIGLGLLTCLLSLCAWQFDYSNKSQIISFAVLLGIIAATECGVGIWALVRSEKIETLPENDMLRALSSLADPGADEAWDNIIRRLKCCGVREKKDYELIRSGRMPTSCCPGNSCYTIGCLEPVINRTKSLLLDVFLLAFASVLIQALIIGLSLCYAKGISESIDRRRDEIMKSIRRSNMSSTTASSRGDITIEHENPNMNENNRLRPLSNTNHKLYQLPNMNEKVNLRPLPPQRNGPPMKI